MLIRGLILASLLSVPVDAQQTDKPNVIFFAIDDLNNWTGALGGHPNALTPNLDRFAARSVHFTNAHCPSPLCGPSRASILSGIRPSTSGVYFFNPSLRTQLPDVVTLPQHFREAGYRVAGAGKIFHGGRNSGEGWHRYQGSKSDPVYRTSTKVPAPFGWGAIPFSDEEMGDYKVVQFAEEELAQNHDKPLFLALGLFKPHLPWKVPAKYFDAHPLERIKLNPLKRDDLADIPPVGWRLAINALGTDAPPGGDHKVIERFNIRREAVQGYLATVTFADAMFGRVIDALDRSQYRDNTIVVVWSDHGWHLGEKNHWRKMALWRLTTQSVLMIRVPGNAPGTRNHAVSLIDLYPTLIGLAGLASRPGLEGRDLSQLVLKAGTRWDHPVLTTYGRGNHSIISNDWHLIRYFDGSSELYHLADAHEWFNLALYPQFRPVIDMLEQHLPSFEAPGTPFFSSAESGISSFGNEPIDPSPASALGNHFR